MAASLDLTSLAKFAVEQGDAYVALALHPFVDEGVQAKLEGIIFARKRLKLTFAAAPYTPKTILALLAEEDDEQLRLRLSKNPAVASPLLVKLFEHASPAVIKSIAAHRNTPVEILELIDWKGNEVIRTALCGNSNAPLALLKQLMQSSTSLEKKGIVSNPNSDHVLLNQLWDDGDKFIQGEVAAHKACPLELREAALQHPEVLVRRKLASNESLATDCLLLLMKDEDALVRSAAIGNAGLEDDHLGNSDDPSIRVRRTEAKREALSAQFIESLADDEDHWVRRWVARQPAASDAVMQKLAQDEVMEVRRAVGRNPSCPDFILERLAKDEDPWVRAGVALREDLTRHILVGLENDEDIDVKSAVGRNPGTDESVLLAIAEHENRDVRRSVIVNPHVPDAALIKLQDDPYPLNRAILSGHPNCLTENLWFLLKDPEPQVRYTAGKALAVRCLRAA